MVLKGAIPSNGVGMVRVVSGSAMMAEEQRIADREAANKANAQPVLSGLAAHVMTCWTAAYTAKSAITERLLKAQRARVGKYDTNVLAEIRKFGGSEEYARITANKCRVAEAWVRDIFVGQTEKPWTLTTSPKPTLQPDVMASVHARIAQEFAVQYTQGGSPSPDELKERAAELIDAENQRVLEESREIAARMEQVMYDQLVEGNWMPEMAAFITDLVTFPAAHFKGPVLRRAPSVQWETTAQGITPIVKDKIKPEFERVDPFRIYPAPGSKSPQEGYIIEHISFSRGDLHDLIGVDGFSELAIRAVLDEFGRGGLVDWITRSAQLERSAINGEQTGYLNTTTNITIDCLEYHGPVQGRQLVEWGMSSDDIIDQEKDYEARVWLIGRWVIKAQLNFDPLGTRPYYKASYEEVPGAYWGYGIPDILEDVQGIGNAALRALVNNMAMASGPMCAVNVSRLPIGEDITNLHPWKIIQVKDSAVGDNSKAIDFFQPDSRVSDNLAVIEKAYSFADDFSLIPRIMAGDGKGGVSRTASGLSMLLDAANKGLKGVISNVDINIMTPLLTSLFNFNMLYNPDNSIKGDCAVVARGAVSLMQLETLQLRRNEFLNATNNPTDTQILGLEGRAEILRETAKGLQLDTTRLVPPRGMVSLPAQQPQPEPTTGGGATLENGAPVTNNFGNSPLRTAR